MSGQIEKKSLLRRRIGPHGWNRYAFANSATRREAKAILFQELSEAVRHGMPLDEALAICMRTEGERAAMRGSDASTRGRIFQSVLALIYLLLAMLGAVVLLVFSSVWAADVERVARVLALRLLPLIQAGHPLSSAMEMLKDDYTTEEVEIVRAGEQWNQLPAALERLGSFQYYERELQRHWARMAYPITLLIIIMALVGFCVVFIAPKFADIFMQLGLELPTSTQVLIDVTGTVSNLGIAIVILLLLLPMFLYILRLFAVGNRVLRDIVAGAVVIFSIWISAWIFNFIMEQTYISLGVIGWIITFTFLAVWGIGLSIFLLFGTEKLILWFDRVAYKWLGAVPLLGAPRKTERESRWLAALSLGLISGTGSAEAVAAAGRICGGEMGRRSAQASDLIRKGYTIGDAVLEAKILRPRWANRLRLLEGRTTYLAGLSDIAEDAARESFHSLNRSSRVAEVFSICLMGLGTGFFAYAMYMPLFQIPLIIGRL